jgi:hypothetical protein
VDWRKKRNRLIGQITPKLPRHFYKPEGKSPSLAKCSVTASKENKMLDVRYWIFDKMPEGNYPISNIQYLIHFNITFGNRR